MHSFYLFRMCHHFFRGDDYVLEISHVGIATTVKSIRGLEFVHPSGGRSGNFGYVWEGGNLVDGETHRTGVGGLVHIRFTVFSFHSTRDINTTRWMLFFIYFFPVGNVMGQHCAYDNGTWDGLGSALQGDFGGSFPLRLWSSWASLSAVGIRCLQPNCDELWAYRAATFL